jgi:cell wall assembly regulator SMI1
MISPAPGVTESWDRIRAWLDQHTPDLLRSVNPPASEEDLLGAEEAVGAALPDDLLAWWRLADGVSGRTGGLLPTHFDPYPVSQALESRRIWLEVWYDEETRVIPDMPGWQEYADGRSAAPAGTVSPDIWLPAWLPIAGSGGGQDLFVDLRPGPLRGSVAHFDKVSTAEAGPLWPSVAATLAAVADALEQGSTTVGGHLVTVEAHNGDIVWG